MNRPIFGPNESDLFYGFEKQKLWFIFLQERKFCEIDNDVKI
jgi:hypothetical protein